MTTLPFDDDLPSLLPCVPSTSTARHQRPTECAICGKPASGYHYEVPSCNGCKTFFRRLIISAKDFQCKANGDCFDLDFRDEPVKCRACRYQKCIKAGMNPLAMHVDATEAQASNFKKLIKRSANDDEDNNDPDTIPLGKEKQAVKLLYAMENKLERTIDSLLYLEAKVDKFRRSSYNPDWKEYGGLKKVLLHHNRITLADKAGPMPGWPLAIAPGPPKNGPGCGPMGGGGPPSYKPEKKMWLHYDLMTTVEYAKTFFFFHNLDFQDRVLLLKYVALACMNLHISFFTVDKKFDTPYHPDGTLAPLRKGMVYAESVMSIKPLIRYKVKQSEYVLLKAICLCNPGVPGLSDHAQRILAKERETLASTLFDYCKRDDSLGPVYFANLIGMIDTLEHQQRHQKNMHLLNVLPNLHRVKNEDRMWLIDDIMTDFEADA